MLYFKTSSVWPPDTKNRFLLRLHKIYVVFVCILLSIVSASLIIATFHSEDIRKIGPSVDIVTMTLSALYKLAFTKMHITRFKAVVNFMDTKFLTNVGTVSRKVENRRCSIYTSIIVSGGVFLAIVYNGIPALEMKLERAEKLLQYGNQTEMLFVPRKLPLACWIPVDVSWSPIYEIVYALETVSFFLAAHIYLTGDAFFFMMVYQICVQLKMLSCLIVKSNEDRVPPIAKGKLLRAVRVNWNIYTVGFFLKKKKNSMPLVIH